MTLNHLSEEGLRTARSEFLEVCEGSSPKELELELKSGQYHIDLPEKGWRVKSLNSVTVRFESFHDSKKGEVLFAFRINPQKNESDFAGCIIEIPLTKIRSSLKAPIPFLLCFKLRHGNKLSQKRDDERLKKCSGFGEWS